MAAAESIATLTVLGALAFLALVIGNWYFFSRQEKGLRVVEKRNFVAEAGCNSGCDSHLLGGVGFLDNSLRPTLEPYTSSYYKTVIEHIVK